MNTHLNLLDLHQHFYPDLIPTHAAPADCEDHRLRTCGEIEDVFKFPKSFTEASTRQWKAPLMKKRKASSECAKRVARIVCSRLGSMAEAEINEYIIADNFRKLRKLTIPVKRGGRRATVQFQDDLDRMELLIAQQKRAKIAMSNRGVKRDNPTKKQARLRKDWPLFNREIQDELKQISHQHVAIFGFYCGRWYRAGDYCRNCGSGLFPQNFQGDCTFRIPVVRRGSAFRFWS
jgi:hypothetical protein